MKLSLDGIPPAVRERVGEALYIAQRLEWCLVCHLLVRRSERRSAVTPEMIDAIESELDRMTLGQLIAELEIERSNENTLTRALTYRNHIAHKFFKIYGGSQRPVIEAAVMLNRLEHMILELRSAVGLMQDSTEALAFALKVDIEAIRRDYDARLSLLAASAKDAQWG